MTTGMTPKGYITVNGDDPMINGDNVITTLAGQIDTNLGRAAAGTAAMAIPTANTATAVAVTFPAGRFNAAPNVVAIRQTAYGNYTHFIWVNGITASGFVLNAYASAVQGSSTYQWIGVQV